MNRRLRRDVSKSISLVSFRPLSCFLALFSAASLLLLGGCSHAHFGETAVVGQSLAGSMKGGQQPISGATIQLFTPGTGSYASSLMTSPVTTDVSGNFTITSKYYCPSSTSPVYLVGTGGNPGLTPVMSNPAISMMAALGTCGDLQTGKAFISMNEVTTVGSIAALLPYMTSYQQVGLNGSSSSQMLAAFANAAEYVDSSLGIAPGPALPANVYASTTELNTLADVISSCINSSGGVAGDGTACGNLFQLASPVSGAAPTETIGAVLNILRSPSSNRTPLFNLTPAGVPFQPTLTKAPSTWSILLIPMPPAPAFNLATGTYFGTQTVSIANSSTAGYSAVYYTLDGSTPTTGSTLLSGNSISLPASATIKAIGLDSTGRVTSPVGSATYTLFADPSMVTAAAGSGQGAKLGTQYAIPLKVSVLDSHGAPYAGIPVTFQVFSSATASLSSNTCSTDVTGTCFVVATAGGSTGTVTVNASAGHASANFLLTNIGPQTISAFSGSGQNAKLGNTFASPLQVKVLDNTGTPYAGAVVSFSTSSSGAGAAFTPGSCVTDATGVCAVSATANLSAGGYTVTAASGSLSASFNLTNIVQATPATISFLGGVQSAKVGTAFAPLQVQVLDNTAAPSPGILLSFTTPSSGPSATITPSSCMTDMAGMCSVSATANGLGGSYSVTASSATLSAATTFTNTLAHSYVVSVITDTTTGVAANCVDQNSGSTNSNARCSLRDAVAAAAVATSSAPATVTFAQTAASTITLANGILILPSNTIVQGATSGGGLTQANLITIDGHGVSSIFKVPTGVTSTVNNLVIANGYNSGLGGGIYNAGSLTVNQTTFSGNSASEGGGIDNAGALVVNNSSFLNNSGGMYGGGIASAFFLTSTLAVNNSTFYGNVAAQGGALYNYAAATVTNSTFSGNRASLGAALYNAGNTSLSNSILNGDTGPECSAIACSPATSYVVFSNSGVTNPVAGKITISFTDSLGKFYSQTASIPASSASTYPPSLFGPYFSYAYQMGAEGDGSVLLLQPLNQATTGTITITADPNLSVVGVQTTFPNLLAGNGIISGVTSAQANLSTLDYHGGPTQTLVPLAGSVAICAISPSAATGTDQRGAPRTTTKNGVTCQDAGAVQTSY